MLFMHKSQLWWYCWSFHIFLHVELNSSSSQLPVRRVRFFFGQKESEIYMTDFCYWSPEVGDALGLHILQTLRCVFFFFECCFFGLCLAVWALTCFYVCYYFLIHGVINLGLISFFICLCWCWLGSLLE